MLPAFDFIIVKGNRDGKANLYIIIIIRVDLTHLRNTTRV